MNEFEFDYDMEIDLGLKALHFLTKEETEVLEEAPFDRELFVVNYDKLSKQKKAKHDRNQQNEDLRRLNANAIY